MGQRHQIYVKFPLAKREPQNQIAGFHHQWLYGITAICSLSRVVKLWINSENKDLPKDNTFRFDGPLRTDTCYGLKRQSSVITSIYSVDLEDGYWHYVHELQENKNEIPSEVLDPRNGDNNDGITIIDVSNPEIFKYCFMSIGHLESEINPKTTLKPMSARQYILYYYPEFMNKKGNWKERDESKGRHEFSQQYFDKSLSALLLIEENTTLLTLPECKQLFPQMYKRKAKEILNENP